MIIRTSPAALNLENTPFQSMEPSGLLFFDIETTGLAARSSSLYLIGAISLQDGRWTATQWFAESPAEEKDVLEAFLEYAISFSQIIHFNGQRFDLPYLKEKCEAFQLPYTLSALISRDLYRMLRPLRELLGLTSMSKKSLEEFLGLFRRDPFNGGELIAVYRKYVKHPADDLLNMLLLHNYEDLLGMLTLIPMLSYRTFLEASYQVSSAECIGNALIIRGWLPCFLPKPFSYRGEHFYLSAEQTYFSMQIPGVRKTLKHFFPDYKNYYFLPLEDTAMHKSIASYVDKEFREPAKASNCYNKKEGFYLPQFSAVFQPVFKENYTDTLLYFLYKEAMLDDKDVLQKYAEHIIEHM